MTPNQLDELEALAKAAPAGKWEIWTSNSWRRVYADQGREKVMLIEPTTQRDRWPDLMFGPGVEAWLEGLTPEVALSLIAEVRRLQVRLEIDEGTQIDGIEARDATIKLQDGLIEALKEDLHAARLLAHANAEMFKAEKADRERIQVEIVGALTDAGACLPVENATGRGEIASAVARLARDAERWRTEMALRNDPVAAIMFVGTNNRCSIYRGGELIASGETYMAAIDAAKEAKC
jgi:hypothetical protein